MEQIKLKASLRDLKGKQEAKRMRKSGSIPAVVYHRGEEPVSISVPDKEMNRIIHTAGGENVLISLTIEKDKKTKGRSVIIKEIQHDPVKRNILHVDFNEISLTEKIQVEVELVAVGEAIGVRQEGGSLENPLRIIKIECLPTDIPKHIDVDVAALKLGDSIHIRDLAVSDKIKVLNDPETILYQVKLHEEKKEEETALPGETPEVEVIREKKEEEAPAKGGSASGGKEEPKSKEAAKPEKK